MHLVGSVDLSFVDGDIQMVDGEDKNNNNSVINNYIILADFPNPAQIITGIRYSFPDIKKYERRNMISKNSNSKTKPKTDKEDPQTRAKKFVERTILMVIEGWYKSKNNSAIKG